MIQKSLELFDAFQFLGLDLDTVLAITSNLEEYEQNFPDFRKIRNIKYMYSDMCPVLVCWEVLLLGMEISGGNRRR